MRTRNLVLIVALALVAGLYSVRPGSVSAADTSFANGKMTANGEMRVDTGGASLYQQVELCPSPAGTTVSTGNFVTNSKFVALKASPGFATTCCFTFDGSTVATTAGIVQGCVLGIPIQGAGDSFSIDGVVTTIKAACTVATTTGACIQMISGK